MKKMLLILVLALLALTALPSMAQGFDEELAAAVKDCKAVADDGIQATLTDVVWFAQPMGSSVYGTYLSTQLESNVSVFNFADSICFVFVEISHSDDGWVQLTDVQAAIEAEEAADAGDDEDGELPDGFVFGDVDDNTLNGGGLDIDIMDEGTIIMGERTVPYASLVSLWDGDERAESAFLCLEPSGCEVSGRGDTRWYQFGDGTQIPVDTLTMWVPTQMGSFPFHDSIITSDGNTIWER
jgi:hypothetical protein